MTCSKEQQNKKKKIQGSESFDLERNGLNTVWGSWQGIHSAEVRASRKLRRRDMQPTGSWTRRPSPSHNRQDQEFFQP